MKPLTIQEVDAIITANKVPRDRFPVVVVAVRGSDLDAGTPGENNRKIYDDLHVLRTPKGCEQWAGNTDPNGFRPGRGKGSKKGMGLLAPGIHLFAPGLHKGKIPAFRQAEPFTLIRDAFAGEEPVRDVGMHAVNWHPGGGDEKSFGQTWSLACQTNPKPTFQLIRGRVLGACLQFHQEEGKNDLGQDGPLIPYILIEETERRKGNLVVSKRYF
jgi:hypothetical protein